MPDQSQQRQWRKSSYSAGQGACVEVASLPDGRIALRDSKNPTGGELVFTPEEWLAFVVGTKQSETV